MDTEPVWLTEPRRKTLLTEVARTRGDREVEFVRSLYYAPDPRYHHPGVGDRGHFLAEGHKIKVTSSRFRRRRDGSLVLVHRIKGVLPEAGAKAQLFLDWDRRWKMMRAHAAMHLFVAACLHQYAEFGETPRVQGGGQLRTTVRFPTGNPRGAVESAVKQANAWVDAKLPITTEYMTRDALAQRGASGHVALDDVAPGEPTLRVCRVGEVLAVPCDAPLPDNTRDVPRLRLASALPRDGGVRVLLRPQEP